MNVVEIMGNVIAARTAAMKALSDADRRDAIARAANVVGYERFKHRAGQGGSAV